MSGKKILAEAYSKDKERIQALTKDVLEKIENIKEAAKMWREQGNLYYNWEKGGFRPLSEYYKDKKIYDNGRNERTTNTYNIKNFQEDMDLATSAKIQHESKAHISYSMAGYLRQLSDDILSEGTPKDREALNQYFADEKYKDIKNDKALDGYFLSFRHISQLLVALRDGTWTPEYSSETVEPKKTELVFSSSATSASSASGSMSAMGSSNEADKKPDEKKESLKRWLVKNWILKVGGL